MADEFTREEVAGVIDRAVADLLQAAGVTAPPVDVIALAQRHLGMLVCIDRRQPQRGRAQRARGQRLIYLRPEPSEERHQWTVAHEIGEHLKPSFLQQLRIEPEQTRAMTGESLANLFANRLLVPTGWFAADSRAVDYDLTQLKTRYHTASHEVIAWRWLDLPEPCVVTIVDNDRVHRRRSNVWRINRKLAPAEQDCLEQVRRDGQAHAVRASKWTVQGWPVHQADWKREILRSVADAEGWDDG